MVSMYKLQGVNVEIYDIPDMDESEAANYVDYLQQVKGMKLVTLKIEPAGTDEVSLTYTCRGERFERIRRITGGIWWVRLTAGTMPSGRKNMTG